MHKGICQWKWTKICWKMAAYEIETGQEGQQQHWKYQRIVQELVALFWMCTICFSLDGNTVFVKAEKVPNSIQFCPQSYCCRLVNWRWRGIQLFIITVIPNILYIQMSKRMKSWEENNFGMAQSDLFLVSLEHICLFFSQIVNEVGVKV